MDSSALTSPKRWQPHTRRASGYPSAVSARQPAPAAAAETPLESPWRDIARILGGDDNLDARAAVLRKRFERAKERLKKLAIERGLIQRG